MIIATHGIVASQIQSYVGLLNLYPNASAAYSLRRLNGNYNGSAIRVRRSSDNTEQDIGFTALGALDTTSLTTFCGSGNGFVTTWYDQSGNARNVTQTTAANQPQIVSSGSVINENSKPTIQFDGSNDFLNGGDILKAGSNSITTFSVAKMGGSSQTIYAKSLLGASSVRYALVSSPTLLSIAGGSIIDAGVNYTVQKLFTVEIIANSTHKLYQNNTEVVSSSITTIGDSSFDFEIGAYNNASGGASNNLPLNGNIQEIVLYFTNQSSNRTGISTNINSYYGIY